MKYEGRWRPRIRVLIVDDEALWRSRIVAMLAGREGISVIGAARDGEEGVEMARAMLPDVVLMDVSMPRLDGMAATERITAEHPTIRVLTFASVQTEESFAEAVRAGAAGFVRKDVGRDKLVEAIKRAAHGDATAGDAHRAVTAAPEGASRSEPPAGLTVRQYQVLRLMSMGLALKQIARELGITEKTVRNQASLMYAKLRVKDRSQAVRDAVRRGFA